MKNKDYKAFIVEGEAREPLIIENISKVFLKHGNIKIITITAGENIYMLWKILKDDDFETYVIEFLREENEGIRKQLMGLSRDDFSEVYLFFDYDAHQTNLGKEDGANAITQMLETFNNETENGKLYINYPMVEALRDFVPGVCECKDNCFIAIKDLSSYKNLSAVHSVNPHFKDYNIDIWKGIIDVFAMRISCLFKNKNVFEYEKYSEVVNSFEVYKCEETYGDKVFILSAFPQFLVDYYGIRLWKTSVKHVKNKLDGDCQINKLNKKH